MLWTAFSSLQQRQPISESSLFDGHTPPASAGSWDPRTRHSLLVPAAGGSSQSLQQFQAPNDTSRACCYASNLIRVHQSGSGARRGTSTSNFCRKLTRTGRPCRPFASHHTSTSILYLTRSVPYIHTLSLSTLNQWLQQMVLPANREAKKRKALLRRAWTLVGPPKTTIRGSSQESVLL